MKKIYLFSTLVAGLLAFNSCNNEPDFPGLDEKSQVANVAKYVTSYAGAVFSAEKPAKDVLPEWLYGRYYTADKGSMAIVDYKYTISTPEYITALDATKPHTLAAADYEEVWGPGSTYNYFSPSNPARTFLPTILKKTIANPAEGNILAVTYNEAEKDGDQIAFKEDFQSGTNKVNIDYNDWINVTVTGTYLWQTRDYFSTLHAQQSANAHAAGKLDSYLISKEITVGSGMILSFDAVYVYYADAGGRVKVLITTDLVGSDLAGIQSTTWTDVTSNFTIPTTGGFANAGSCDLSAYEGKKIRIAFRYEGDSTTGATSTIRIDDVVVKEPNKVTSKIALYQYTEDAWKAYGEAYVLQPEDYVAMGIENLTATMAQAHLPAFLAQKYPLATPGTIQAVVFKTSDTAYMAIEFQKEDFGWTLTGGITDMTDEYEFDGSKWVYVRTVPKAALNEGFEGRDFVSKEKTIISGWLNAMVKGEDFWYDKEYSKNVYTEATAYNSKSAGEIDIWLVTPQLEIKNNFILTFDMVSGYWTHEALQVFISSSFSGEEEDLAKSIEDGQWTEIEGFDFPVKEGGYSPFTNVGSASLANYVGQNVYIAFRYWGDKTQGKTSTVQLDNIYVGE